MLQGKNSKIRPDLQSGYSVRIPTLPPPLAFVYSAGYGFVFSMVNIVAKIKSLHMVGFFGYSYFVTAKSVTGFDSPIRRRMHRLFKNWRFFCAQNTGTKRPLLGIACKNFGVSGGEPRARRPFDRSVNPPDAPFLFDSGKGKDFFFEGASNIMSEFLSAENQSRFAIQANFPQVEENDNQAVIALADQVVDAHTVTGEQLLVDMARNRKSIDWRKPTDAINRLTHELSDSLHLLLSELDYWDNPWSRSSIAVRKIARSLHNLNDFKAGGFDHAK